MANGRFLNLLSGSLLLFLILLNIASPAAETPDYLIDVWTSDNDLPDSSITSIAQTPDGYLWIGTYNGLARFDGARFVTFDPINTPQLKNARVTELFVDRWGALWINTFDGSMTSLRNGVFTYEWHGGHVLSVFSNSNQVLFALAGHHNTIVCRDQSVRAHGEWKEIALAGSVTGDNFKQDRDGNIWYTLTNSLYRLAGAISEPMRQSTGWRGTSVTCMSTDSDGNFWIGTDAGLARWINGRFEEVAPFEGASELKVSSLACATNGCWVFGGGKVRKCVNRRWIAEADLKSWQDLGDIFQLDLNAYQDREGGLWFTHRGLGLFHSDVNGRTEHFSTDNGLPSNLASCWFQDREGNIWVGLLRGGLLRLRKKQFEIIGQANGLAAAAVSSVCEDAAGNVWIGTFSGGLYRWNDGQLDQIRLPEGAYKECFFSCYPDSENRLWLSAGREDLFMLQNGKIIPSSNVVHGIKAILVDDQGRTWLGRSGGLSCLANGALKNFSSTNGLTDIRCLAEDRHGVIWIGTGGGNLFRCENGNFTRYRTGDGQENRAIWSLLPEADGTLWMGTFRGGLVRFKHGKFTRYSVRDGLPSDVICQILDDGLGKLWMGSHKGIFYVPKQAFQELDAGGIQSLPCVVYGLFDGLPTLECSGNYQPACWRGHDGKLWFATVKGLVSVFPDEPFRNHLPPPVIVEDILVDGKPLAVAAGGPPVSIAPGRHQLDFRYTALSFIEPDKVGFRYKLEGLDEQWVDAGSKRSAHYGPLPPGKYQFHVIASNNDGVWNETGSALAFVMRPYFWQTWWFKCLVMAGLGGMIFGAVRFVATRKLRRKLEALKQQRAIERDRERIARDIHDDLGAGLTQIMLQSAMGRNDPPEQMKVHLSQISETARELVRDMDETVWAINPENDTLDGLITYMGKFVQDYVSAARLRCRLDLPAQLPAIPVSSELRHNLFHAVKEALNNAVKHAQASEIYFQLKLDASTFTLLIRDNGKGFRFDALPEVPAANGRISSGHGLGNLAARLKRIGGSCAVTSRPGAGTEVRLTSVIQVGGKNGPG